MKNYRSTFLLATFTLVSAAGFAADTPAPATPVAPPAAPRVRASPHETISAYCAGNRQTGSFVTITYGRPFSAKGGKGEVRKIWGGLVPWDKADRLGSDEATTIITQHPIEIGGKTIPAGAHTLYIVASEAGTSKLAFSSRIGKWGIPVDEKNDVARVDLKKDEVAAPVDQLTLALESTPTGGILKIVWEKTQYSVAFTVKRA